jgi:arachidonate 15-lipoxygenase
MFLFRQRAAALPTDADRAARQRALDRVREVYDYERAPALRNVIISKKELPFAELPSLGWILSFLRIFMHLKASLAAAPARLWTSRVAGGGADGSDAGSPPPSLPPQPSSSGTSELVYEMWSMIPAAKTALWQGSEAAIQQIEAEHGQRLYDIIDANVATIRELRQQQPDAVQTTRDPSHGAVERSDVARETSEHHAMVDMDDLSAEDRAFFDSFTSDASFARARVAGLNPMSLRAVTHADMDDPNGEWLPIDDHLRDAAPGFDGDTLVGACEQNRLYILEYKWLEAAPECLQQDRYVFIPKALFAVPPRSRDREQIPLAPVAIWIYRKGASAQEAKLYTPRDGYSWEIAKIIVNVLDGNDHEYYQHLTLTHLLLEPFGIALKRQLHRDHPLARLLETHFTGTMFINKKAVSVLLAEGGGVDNNMIAPIHQMGPVLNEKLAEIPFNDQFVEGNLRSRGVTDAKLSFPYRDDARRLWTAIAAWVEAYVSEYYSDDKDVTDDTELQAWAKEIATNEVVTITKFGDEKFLNGRSELVISDRAYLIDALTMIIFTASCQHAALNFAQKPFLSYAPAWPLAMKKPELPPSRDVGRQTSCAEWKSWLPSLKETQVQWSINQLLGGLHYTRLGEYPSNVTAGKPALIACLSVFKTALTGIGNDIDLRERSSSIKYRVLHPDQIPASINI